MMALTHTSYANENGIERCCTNQRLEFLGDSVLELLSSEYIYKCYPTYGEGQLTKVRSRLVCEESLADVARELHLYKFLRLGKGEEVEKVMHNNSIMCDTIEAIIGAIYLDNGIYDAYNFIKNFIITTKNLSKDNNDFKSILQEYVNSKNYNLKYDLIDESGPDHEKEFTVSLIINDNEISSGKGRSKKEAEQNAAKLAIESLYKGKVCI